MLQIACNVVMSMYVQCVIIIYQLSMVHVYHVLFKIVKHVQLKMYVDHVCKTSNWLKTILVIHSHVQLLIAQYVQIMMFVVNVSIYSQ